MDDVEFMMETNQRILLTQEKTYSGRKTDRIKNITERAIHKQIISQSASKRQARLEKTKSTNSKGKKWPVKEERLQILSHVYSLRHSAKLCRNNNT